MQDDLILVVLTIKVLSLSSFFGVFLDWSVLIAAFRLAAVVSALVK